MKIRTAELIFSIQVEIIPNKTLKKVDDGFRWICLCHVSVLLVHVRGNLFNIV